eukprot:Gb_05649 [translate_table: standard]
MAKLWNRSKNMALFFEHSLGLHSTKASLTTETKAGALNVEQSSANNISGDDVRILCQKRRLKDAFRILHLIDHPDCSTYASLLRGCSNRKALPEGRLVHAHIIERGCQIGVFLGNTLVLMYAGCGSLMDARRILDEMPIRNVVSWTAMIAEYTQNGHVDEALALYYQMQRTGIQPNQFTFSSVLPACASLAALRHGKEIHDDIIRSGFQSNVFVGSALVDMYVKCGSLEDARKVFDKLPDRNVVSWNAMIAGYAHNGHVDEALKLFQKMPKRDVVSWTALVAGYAQIGLVDEAEKLFEKMPNRNVVSWTAMIAGYAQSGHFDEALKLFGQMQRAGLKPNSVTFASVIPACANLAALEQGKEVHEDIIRSGFQSDIFVGNALVDMYAKCGNVDNARKVLDKMPIRNVISWTAMIVGYAMHGCGREAIYLFEQMQQSKTKPNHVTFIGVLSACCHAGLVDDGWQYFERMSRDYHLAPAAEHYCCMVDLLGRAGLLNEAQDFINKMPIKPDAAVWGSLLGACRIHSNIVLGERVADRLFESDPKDAAHYVLLSNIYAAAGRWDDVEKVRKMMKHRRITKMPGCSWIEVDSKVHTFLVGDRSHPQTHEIYTKLDRLSGKMKEAGYVPNTNFALYDVEEEHKEHIVGHHSEKLAIAFGLINTSLGTPIRIVKNLRVCGDCHSAIKFISKIVAREIVLRDAYRFHHFKDGQCSCGDYW